MLRLGGFVGHSDPLKLTLKELDWMAEGVRDQDRLAWNHTFAVCGMILNTIPRKPGSKAVEIMDFYPYRREQAPRKAPPPTKAQREMLRKLAPAIGRKRGKR